jgi:hypothetical protein
VRNHAFEQPWHHRQTLGTLARASRCHSRY